MAEPPVSPRLAATVLLLRDGDSGVETWLMRRVPKMAFAPSASVFPGGGVDPVDTEGESAPEVAERFGVDAELAGVVVRAAVREVEEETGVRLDPSTLQPWARWITPEVESRRYDTYFFAAVLPAGALAESISTEASVAEWVPVVEALTQYDRGERRMLPPTVHNLTALTAFGSAAAAVSSAAGRVLTPIMPTLVLGAEGGPVADLGNGEVLPLPANFISATGRTRS